MARATISTPAASDTPGAPAPRGALRRLSDGACFYALLVLFWFLCACWSLPAAALFWLVPRRHRPRVGQYAIMTGFRFFLALMRWSGLARFDLASLDALAGEGPMIIVTNHRSLLDAPLVISRLPRVVCITKAALWDSSFLGGGIRMAGYLRNDAPLRLVRRASQALAGGQQLLIFPEGTRASSDTMGPFKAGFALMGKAAGVPVQTVFLEGNSGFLQKGWGLFRRPAFPLVYRARLGRRFEVIGDTGRFTAECEQYCRDELTGRRHAA